MDIEGKVAVVTGSGLGIGRGVAKCLASAGAVVVVNDINEPDGCETVHMIESAGGSARFFRADVTDDGDVRRLIAFTEESGGLAVLVNNAGAYYEPPYYPEADPTDWGRIIGIFLTAYMNVTQHGIRAMRARGGGAVVNISSMAGVGFAPDNDWPDYAAAKAAVMRLTATLAPLSERVNVRVNCICPGWVATERVRDYTWRLTEDELRAADVPAGGAEAMLQAADIGDAVLHFVRDESLAGRIMLYYEPGKKRLVPPDLNLFALSDEL